LFDDEAIHDLELDATDASGPYDHAELDGPSEAALVSNTWESEEEDDDSARSAAEPGELPSYRHAVAAEDSALSEREPREASIHERPRPAMLPLAMTLILGLLLGFAAGYMAAGRGSPAQTQAAVPPPATRTGTEAAPVPQRSGESQPQRSGREWSEQVVGQRSATPPPVPGDAPATASARPPASRGAAATAGTMTVRSSPPRAGVTVNGTWRGRTPLTLDRLRFGAYTVRVVQPGFATAREEVRLSAADPSKTVSVRLRRNSAPAPSAAAAGSAETALVGSLYVDSRPRGARVMLDGRPVGTTPTRINDVKIGSHVVRLELADHRLWAISTSVTAGRETPVTGSLEPIR
jgi:hypothetical protein